MACCGRRGVSWFKAQLKSWPFIQGMVRAEQDQVNYEPQKRVAGLLVHGDAAFAGLGSVAECLQMSGVTGRGYFERILDLRHTSSLADCKAGPTVVLAGPTLVPARSSI